MSEVNVKSKSQEIINENEPKTVPETTTLIDSLLDEKSFTSIENLKITDNDDTIINNSYITDGDDKKTTFLDMIKKSEEANNGHNDDDDDNESVTTAHSLSKNRLQVHGHGHCRVVSIDDNENDVLGLVNDKFLKRIQSNDSLELKHKSMTKLENLTDLDNVLANMSDSVSNSIVSITIDYADDNNNENNDNSNNNDNNDNNDINKSSLNSSMEFSSSESLNNNLALDVNKLNNNDNTINPINKNILNSGKCGRSTEMFSSQAKTHRKEGSTVSNISFSSIKENKVCDDTLDLDAIFSKMIYFIFNIILLLIIFFYLIVIFFIFNFILINTIYIHIYIYIYLFLSLSIIIKKKKKIKGQIIAI